jgi:hypothetical protein
MEFGDAFAQAKAELGAKSRKAKSETSLSAAEQLANWRAHPVNNASATPYDLSRQQHNGVQETPIESP